MRQLILTTMLLAGCALEAPTSLDTYDDGYDACISDYDIDAIMAEMDVLSNKLTECSDDLIDERWTFDYETNRLNDLNRALKYQIRSLQTQLDSQ